MNGGLKIDTGGLGISTGVLRMSASLKVSARLELRIELRLGAGRFCCDS